ncbi:MAG: hypothetical protein GEV10_30040 [Streptosporangiales bacterium]|nr:hypothetical protein [Streptosporangiales bacterium]
MSRRGNARRASDAGQRPHRHTHGNAAVQHPGRSAGPARYYAQFPAGLSALVTASLEADVQAKLEFSDDSSAMFTSETSVRAIADLPYLKNVFHVLYDVPRRNLASALESFSAALAEGRLQLPREANGRPFRLMAHIDGQLAPLPKPARTHLENAIGRAARARVEARGLGEEYWIVGRRDLDRFLLARRGPKMTSKTRVPAGSLAPEVSDLLIRMSEPSKGDRFLDPFGGSHALARARSRYPAASIITSDTVLSRDADPGDLPRQVVVRCEDARQLPSIEDGSVTTIVTDPPWGEYESVDDLRKFLVATFASFARVLNPRGSRVVVLMNRRGVGLLLDVAQEAGFQVVASHDILVNGHPATATLLRPAPA